MLFFFLYRKALECIDSVKEIEQKNNQIKNQKIKDCLIEKVLSNQSKNYELIEFIDNIVIRTTCLLNYITHIESSCLATRLIKGILLHNNAKDIESKDIEKLSKWLRDITVYAEMSAKLAIPAITWRIVRNLSVSNPEKILQLLLEEKEYKLCRRWSEIHPLAASICDEMMNIFQQAIEDDQLNETLFKLIETLPVSDVAELYNQLLHILQNVQALNYLVNWLLAHNVPAATYQNIRISLKIFELSTPEWHLLSQPLLLIEQLLMNSRFDTLARILNGIRPLICVDRPCKYCYEHREHIFDACGTYNSKSRSNVICDINEFIVIHNEFTSLNEHSITTECIDSLLRIYASKALDFRVIESQSSNDLLSQTTDHTMSSLDSLCGTFVMPREALPRTAWIRDEEASHCMCCRRSAFTMFTRRHHCRYCGRVVCYACSTKRMSIPTLYADVIVRACDDCFKQTVYQNYKGVPLAATSSKGNASPVSPHTHTAELSEWQFSGTSKHDELLREEFSFEYAPSVSLCLSILVFHSSIGLECAQFLLYHCRKFESLLRPLQPGHPNPEIDYALVTRMLHCLALAAKVMDF